MLLDRCCFWSYSVEVSSAILRFLLSLYASLGPLRFCEFSAISFSEISTAVFEDKVFNLAVKVTNVYYFFTLSSDSYQR